ncbi:MAG: PEPxxWA-CTERM sorting domain-containing protein [Chthoniobacteraceae bacterium]
MLSGSTSVLNLNFGATAYETIAGLSINGIGIAYGTYTAAQLDSIIGTSQVSGTGNLTVVPEPGTWAMVLGGAGLLGGLQRRRRSRHS